MNTEDERPLPPEDAIQSGAPEPLATAEASVALVDDARRALRAAIIGLMVLPLGFVLQYAFGRSDQVALSLVIFLVLGLVGEVYATLLLVKVYPARKSLPRESRRKVRIAALLNAGIYMTLLAMCVTPLLPLLRHEENLRRFDHPPGMAGTWDYKSPDGKDHLELVLKSNGDLHYQQLTEPKCDFRGSWCLENWAFFFRMERLLFGDWPAGGQIVHYEFEGFTEDSLELRDAHRRMRFSRKNN